MKVNKPENSFNTSVENAHELERLQALEAYRISLGGQEDSFDDISRLAAAISGMPRVVISFIEKEKVVIKSSLNFNYKDYPRELAFCNQIKSSTTILVVEDARLDERFKDLPLVTGAEEIIFYAGVPLVNFEGFLLGTISVFDNEPRELSEQQLDSLQILSRQVMRLLERRRKYYLLQDTNIALERALKNVYSEQTEISANESRMYDLIKYAPVAISILMGRGLIVETANEMMLRVWGKNNMVIGMPLLKALPEIADQGYLTLLDQVFTTGQTYYGHEEEVKLVHNDVEKSCFLNFIYEPLVNDAGSIYAILVIASDVTELAESRAALKDSNSNLRLALDAGQLGLYDLTIETGEMKCSARCKANFGLAEDAVFNLPELFKAILPEYHEQVKAAIQKAIDHYTVYNAEYEVLWPNGERHWITAAGQPRYSKDGKAVRMVGITRLK